jgi:hypothetical protein
LREKILLLSGGLKRSSDRPAAAFFTSHSRSILFLQAEPVTSQRKTSLIMFVLLGTLIFVYSFGNAFYETRGIEPLPTFEFLYRAAFLCGVVWWLNGEAAHTSVSRLYCPGLMVSIGWPIIILYYLFKTRGAKGLIPLLALLGIFLVAHLLGAIAYVSFYD